MYLERTEKLAILHSALWMAPDDRIDLCEWRTRFVTDSDLVNLCGTTACAIGWATSLPMFRALGFKMKDGAPVYGAATGWTAVTEFFDITMSQAHCLFMDEPDINGQTILESDLREITGARPGRDTETHLTDREKVLRRIRRFLDADCELDSSEKKQLKKGEKIRKAQITEDAPIEF